jgi:hypothetical protein
LTRVVRRRDADPDGTVAADREVRKATRSS